MKTRHKLSALAVAMLLGGATAFAQYCTPVYTTGTSDNDRIDGVVLGDISNTASGGEITDIGYSDYTDLSTDLSNGATYTLSVTNGPSWSTTITAWIDFNQDEVFDTDEVLGNLSLSAAATGDITFTVPVTALAGETRMRVRGVYPSGLGTPLDPCSSQTYGEAEDYTVNLSGPLENNLTVTGIPAPASGADLGTVNVTVSIWNSGANDASGFTISYNVDGGLITSEVYGGTLAAGESVDFTFGDDFTFSDYGCYDFLAWIDWADDSFDGDDSYSKTVCNAGPVTGTGAWYVNSNTTGEPWGSTSNTDAMDAVFGAGGWSMEHYETADPFVLFSSENCFVFLEGSDAHANELETFLDANMTTIESWVSGGGRLLLNAAPNEGDGMSFGFDGTSLIYSYFTGTGEAADPGHPIFAGPFTPVGTAWTGSSFGHARIEGSDLNNLIVDQAAPSNVVLAEKYYGAGVVLFGGMTTNNFHTPATEAANLRANIISYLSCAGGDVCEAVTGLSGDPGTTTATLSWDDMGATKYRFAFGKVGDPGTFQAGEVFTTFVTFSGLTPGATYTARVARDCYPDGWSATSEITWTQSLRLGQVEQEVLLYPNPSNGQFRLQLNGYENSDLNIMIANTMGQVVYNTNINVNSAIMVQDINLSDAAAGTYIVRLTNGTETSVQTLVIE